MPATPPTYVTVTDHYQDGSGNPLAGRVIFRPSVTVKHLTASIPKAPVIAKISAAGDLSVQLVANNGPGITPVGWTYDVTVITGPPGSAGVPGIDGWARDDFSIALPSSPSSVILRNLTKVAPVPEFLFQVKTVAGVGADVGGNVHLTATDLEMDGVGFASSASLAALVATRGAVNGLASLDGAGLVPVAQLPAIALSDYLGSVASQAAMLALTGQRGDWCVRSDLSTTWILNAEPSSVLGNWTQLPTPTDLVLSVAGKTGAVTLVKADVGLSNVDNTSDVNKPVSTATTTALAGKAATSHTHAIADVTGLQTSLDDNSGPPSPESATLGDFVSSVPRWACSASDTLTNQVLTLYGAVAMRSFSSTKIRFHVRTAVGSPGIVTAALFKGTSRASLAKVGSDITVTTQFGSTGPKELAVSSFAVTKGDWCYLALLHTNAGTDPAVSVIASGVSTDLMNPASTQVICGFKTAQTSIPASVDMTTGWTIYSKMAWWALAA